MVQTPVKGPLKQPFGTLGHEVKRDVHRRNLDAKLIVTSHNSRPGLGKTTLAIQMARDFDRHGWSAEQKGFMDAHKYHNAYDDQPAGSALVFDEVEGEADSRRSMSTKNVELSQAWAQNRYRNMITICTLPSVSMLDKRMLEMSDYWINVIDRGTAHPYRVLVNDFNGNIIRQRMDEDAVITYPDLPDKDSDKKWFDEEKHERRTSIEKQYFEEEELEQRLEEKEEKVRMQLRNEWVETLSEETDMSIRSIADLSIIEVSRPRLHQILGD